MLEGFTNVAGDVDGLNFQGAEIKDPAAIVISDENHIIRRQGLAGGWNTATTADKTRANAGAVRTPTERTINPAWAVNSLPGRAKLATRSPPDAKSGTSNGTAAGSPYGLLVI
jgi:hypothetical protein